MKNKRMKLTALAMSVLMATSTITSVTWAADLFTDGAPAEVVVEAPADIISDVEETGAADDAELTGYSVANIQSVVFKYDTGVPSTASKVVAEFIFNDGRKFEKDAKPSKTVEGSCTAPEIAIYEATMNGNNGPMTVYTTENKATTESGSFFVGPGNQIYQPPTGYMIIPGSQAPTGHIRSRDTYVVVDATHAIGGKGVEYNKCSRCGLVLPDGEDNGSMVGNLSRPQEVFKNNNANFNIIRNATGGSQQQLIYPNPVGGQVTVRVYDIDVTKHNYDEANPVPMYGTRQATDTDGNGRLDFISGTLGRYNDYTVENYGGIDNIDAFEPVGCSWDGVHNVMVVDNPAGNIDAYYYYVVVCKDCRTIKFWDKVYLKPELFTIVQ